MPEECLEDNIGFYDELDSANLLLREQGDLVTDYSDILRSFTSEITAATESHGDDQQKERFDAIGAIMLSRSKEMMKVTSNLKEKFGSHSRSFENVLLMFDEFDPRGNIAAILELRDHIAEAADSIESFSNTLILTKSSTDSLPRATKKFNLGKRNTSAALGDMADVVQDIVKRFREYASYLDIYKDK